MVELTVWLLSTQLSVLVYGSIYSNVLVYLGFEDFVLYFRNLCCSCASTVITGMTLSEIVAGRKIMAKSLGS